MIPFCLPCYIILLKRAEQHHNSLNTALKRSSMVIILQFLLKILHCLAMNDVIPNVPDTQNSHLVSQDPVKVHLLPTLSHCLGHMIGQILLNECTVPGCVHLHRYVMAGSKCVGLLCLLITRLFNGKELYCEITPFRLIKALHT